MSFWRALCVYRLFIQRCIQRRGNEIPSKTWAFIFTELQCFRLTACFFRKKNLLAFVSRLKYPEMLKKWNKIFPCAAFLSDLLSHMFPSGMHKKFLWIIHKYLGRNQLLLLNKKIGQEADSSCSILLYLEENWIKRK